MEQQWFEFIERHWAILLTVLTFLSGVLWLRLDARYAKKKELSDLSDKQRDIVHRLANTERDVGYLPGPKDVEIMRHSIEGLRGEISGLHATIKGLAHLVDLLVEKEVKEQ